MSACYQGIRAVTRFSAFAARAGVQGLHQADRDLLERYLASLHRELAGNTREQRGSVGELSTFLLAIRRHGWEPALPATAIIFPEDYPKASPPASPRAGRPRHGPGRRPRQPRPVGQPRLPAHHRHPHPLRAADLQRRHPAARLRRHRRRRRPLPALPQHQDETRSARAHRRANSSP